VLGWISWILPWSFSLFSLFFWSARIGYFDVSDFDAGFHPHVEQSRRHSGKGGGEF
jgi:hypothetical protein